MFNVYDSMDANLIDEINVSATVGVYEPLIEYQEDSTVFEVKKVNSDVDTKVTKDLIKETFNIGDDEFDISFEDQQATYNAELRVRYYEGVNEPDIECLEITFKE